MKPFPYKHKWSLVLPVLLGLAWILVGCAPHVSTGQAAITHTDQELGQGNSFGQTFTARFAGLSGIEFFLQPDQPGSGDLLLHLRASPQSPTDLATSRLPLSAVTAPAYVRFDFPALNSSDLTSYYAVLDCPDCQGSVNIGYAQDTNNNLFLDGSLYQDGQPAAGAQMAFRLDYDPPALVGGLLRQGVTWLWQSLMALLVFVLPGWALLAGLWRGWDDLNGPEKLGLGAGLSLALYPLLFLFTGLVHFYPGAFFAWVPAGAALLYLAWRNRTALRAPLAALHRARQSANLLPDLAFLGVLALAALARYWAIRTVPVPMWGDSYQHTMIAQLMLDHGGLFRSWQPYVPYTTLTVQYGFSAASAVYAWISGAGISQAVLWTGQVINLLAVAALYPLATRLSRGSRWAGVFAVLIGGLFVSIPAVYVNWGRYAQLAGQAVLPVALWMLWENAASPSFDWKKILLAAAALAGMMLCYYRMPFYYASFSLAWLLIEVLPALKLNGRKWLAWLAKVVPVGIAGGLLVIPWLARVSGSQLAENVQSGLLRTPPLTLIRADYAIWSTYADYIPPLLVLLAAAAWLWSLARRRWLVSIAALGMLVLSAIKAGQLINLPGANMMQSYAVLIAAYIPLALLLGDGLGALAQGLAARLPRLGAVALLVIALLGGLVGAWNQRGLSDPNTYAIVTRPDLRAMDWIRQNTLPNARFLVEAFRIYGNTTAVGSDGGWWIPLLAGRQNSMPPQYALMNEVSDPPDAGQRMVALVGVLEENPLDSPAVTQALCQEGITHVYVGQKQGQAGINVPQLYAPADLQKDPAFTELYHQDRVYVFAFDRSGCPEAP